jgi:hypothetical protein
MTDAIDDLAFELEEDDLSDEDKELLDKYHRYKDQHIHLHFYELTGTITLDEIIRLTKLV